MSRSLAIPSVLALLLSLGTAWGAPGAHRALLIGVETYGPDALAVAPPLAGSGNDVALLAATLRDGWAAEEVAGTIELLTDRPDLLDPADRGGARPPTRAAILAGLDGLVAATEPGDEVFLYLSGHGAQVPALPGAGDEPDGLDEIYLPADFRLSRANGRIELTNTLSDDLIGRFSAGIVRRGGFLWLVIDACHAGSMLRDAGGGITPRRLDFAAEALPVVDLTPRSETGRTAGPAGLDAVDFLPPAGAGAGGFVGFFAAAPGSLAYEAPLGGGTADTGSERRRVHGVLTWSLVSGLRAGQARSYADLARETTARLWGLKDIAAAPVFAGDLGARPMLGETARAADGVRRVALRSGEDGLAVLAGRIDGLVPGMRVPLRQRGDAAGPPLVVTEVVEAGIDTARLRPLAGDAPGIEPGRLDAVLRGEGLDPRRFRDRWLADRAADLYAEVTDTPLAGPVSIAAPPPERTPAALAEALRRLAAEPGVSIASDGGGRADLRLEVVRGGLWLVGTGDPVRPVRLGAATGANEADAIEAALRRQVRARALLSVGRAFAATDLARALRISVRRRPAALPPAGPCPPAGRDAAPGPADPLVFDSAGLIQRGTIRHCDLVFVEVTNTGARAVDLSAFYLDPSGRIFFLDGYVGAELGGLQVSPGATRSLAYVEDLSGSPEAAGPVDLLLLAVPADPAAPAPRDFRHLQSPAEPDALLRGASEPRDGLEALLAGAGLAPFHRGAPAALVDAAGTAIVPLSTVGPVGVGDAR